jgi:hypothetical protein
VSIGRATCSYGDLLSAAVFGFDLEALEWRVLNNDFEGTAD